MKYDFIGIGATVLLSMINVRDEVTAWIGVICTVLVTFVTCLVQVYRLWRDRDTDLKKQEDEAPKEDTEAKDDNDKSIH